MDPKEVWEVRKGHGLTYGTRSDSASAALSSVTHSIPLPACTQPHPHEQTPIRHFCESVADPTSPEYWSAFSSLGITLFALLCLFTGHHSNALVKLTAAVLAW